MRVVIVHIPVGEPRSLETFAKAMAAVISSRGHEVEVFSGARGDGGNLGPRLTMADYVILGSEPVGLRGKIPPRVPDFLKQTSGLLGKRSMAFLRKRGLFGGRALARLMKAMEGEGMYVNYGEFVATIAEAEAAAKEAPIERTR